MGLQLIANESKSKGIEKIMQLSAVSANTIRNLSLSLAVGSILQEIKGDIDGALLRYKLSDCFESPAIWNNIGLCFVAKKKYVAAVSCLKRALYLNPFDHRINYNIGLLNFQLRQFASAFHFFKAGIAHQNVSVTYSLLALCLEQLDDDLNAKQAHLTAIKANKSVPNPTSLLNYAIYLINLNQDQYKEEIAEIMIEFEKNWLKRRQVTNEFDESVMKTANQISAVFGPSSHMAWVKGVKEDNQEDRNYNPQSTLTHQSEQDSNKMTFV